MIKKSEKFSIVGGGGFGLEVAGYIKEIYQNSNVSINIWDDSLSSYFKYPEFIYRGKISEITISKNETTLVCIGDCSQRARVAVLLREKGIELGTFIHPTAVISSYAKVAPGCIVLPFSCISFSAKLGWNTVINSHVGVGHHANIGDHCVVCPQSLIAGYAVIGNMVFMGASSIITPEKSIGNNTTISAGSVIYRNYGDNAFVSGNPSKNYNKGV